MARPDYAANLDRHIGEAETLAGAIIAPVLDARDEHSARGHALIDPAAMHGNRWPALYGGFLFDLAYRACALAVGGRPVSLELHFLRAVRRADVLERDGLTLEWRVAIGARGEGASRQTAPAHGADSTALRALTVELGDAGKPIAYGIAVFAAAADDRAPRSGAPPSSARAAATAPKRLVLPAHDSNWSPGVIRGRCLELPGSLPAIADTLLAKAMSTVRGDDCPPEMDEHYLVRTLSYWWVEPVDDALATFEARVIQRGRRMALAVGTLSVDGRVVGRTAGTVALQQTRKADH